MIHVDTVQDKPIQHKLYSAVETKTGLKFLSEAFSYQSDLIIRSCVMYIDQHVVFSRQSAMLVQ